MGAKHMCHTTRRLCSSVFNLLLLEAMAELFDDSVICDLIRKINQQVKRWSMYIRTTPNTHMEATASSVHERASQER